MKRVKTIAVIIVTNAKEVKQGRMTNSELQYEKQVTWSGAARLPYF